MKITCHAYRGGKGIAVTALKDPHLASSRVKVHLRTGEKSFSCNQCDKSFSHPCHLRTHMQIMYGFACVQSDKSFSVWCSQATHEDSYWGEVILLQPMWNFFSVPRKPKDTHVNAYMEEGIVLQAMWQDFLWQSSLKTHMRSILERSRFPATNVTSLSIILVT